MAVESIKNRRSSSTFIIKKAFIDSYVLLKARINAWATYDLATNMTIFLLLLYPGDQWYIQRPVVILGIAGLLFREIQKSEWFWFVISIVLLAGYYQNWPTTDNHKWLLVYWCIAIYFSTKSKDKDKYLAINGRLLIGLAFTFATFWKLVSSDFLDGTFFHYSLLMDDRFSSIAAIFSSVETPMFVQNRRLLESLLHYESTISWIQLQDTMLTVIVAKGLTLWTILIEGAIALLFLLPQYYRLARWRDAILLLFILTTYSIAPVVGFGWLLTIMGAAQSNPSTSINRIAYIAVFFLIQIYLIPWRLILGL